MKYRPLRLGEPGHSYHAAPYVVYCSRQVKRKHHNLRHVANDAKLVVQSGEPRELPIKWAETIRLPLGDIWHGSCFLWLCPVATSGSLSAVAWTTRSTWCRPSWSQGNTSGLAPSSQPFRAWCSPVFYLLFAVWYSPEFYLYYVPVSSLFHGRRRIHFIGYV